MKFQPDLCADVPIVAGRRGAAEAEPEISTICSPMSRCRAPCAPIPPARR